MLDKNRRTGAHRLQGLQREDYCFRLRMDFSTKKEEKKNNQPGHLARGEFVVSGGIQVDGFSTREKSEKKTGNNSSHGYGSFKGQRLTLEKEQKRRPNRLIAFKRVAQHDGWKSSLSHSGADSARKIPIGTQGGRSVGLTTGMKRNKLNLKIKK